MKILSTLSFFVEGEPKGKARPRFNSITGRTYTPENTVIYENLINLRYREAASRLSNSERALYYAHPIELILDILFPIPQSYSKKRATKCAEQIEYPKKKPDIDNVIKAVCDALNSTCFKDDTQVVKLMANKRYVAVGEQCGINIQISALPEDDEKNSEWNKADFDP